MPNPEKPSPNDKLVEQYELPEEAFAPTEEESPARKGQFVKADETAKHSPFQVKLALDAGLSQEDIDGYSPDQLEAVVAREYRGLRAERERLLRETTHRQKVADEPSGVPAEFADDTKPDALDLGLKSADDDAENGFHPSIVAAFSKLKDHFEKRLAAVEKAHAETSGYVKHQQALTEQQQIDQWFGQHADLFGKGSIADLKKGDPTLLKRQAFIRSAAAMQEKGEPIPATLARAKEILYGASPAPKTEPTPEPPAGPTPRQRAWDEGGVTRGSRQLPADLPKGKERAIRAAANHPDYVASKNGAADEYDSLPD